MAAELIDLSRWAEPTLLMRLFLDVVRILMMIVLQSSKMTTTLAYVHLVTTPETDLCWWQYIPYLLQESFVKIPKSLVDELSWIVNEMKERQESVRQKIIEDSAHQNVSATYALNICCPALAGAFNCTF